MKKETRHIFDGWFSITLPGEWGYHNDEEVLNIYSNKNAFGVIQISFFHKDDSQDIIKIANDQLDRFIAQYRINIDIITRKILEAPSYTVAIASGEYNGDFIKIWVLVNELKMLLITYISPKKSREISKVEDIIYSINFL